MKSKRVLALLLTVVMTVGLLAGCGQEEQKQKESSSVPAESKTQEASSEEKEPELEPYTVTYWMRGEESKDHDKIMELVNAKIQETLPNTELEIVWVASSEYNDRWTKALAAGEKIDIGWSASWVNSPKSDVGNGVVLDVEEQLKEYGQGILDAIGGWDVVDMNRIDGGVYHILAWQGLVGGRYALYVTEAAAAGLPEGWLEESEKIFQEHDGFSVEDKMALMDRIEEGLEYIEAAGLMGEGLNKGAMSNLLENKNASEGLVLNNHTVCVTLKDGVYTVMPWFQNEVYKAYADRLNDWYKRGWYRSDVLSAPTDYLPEHAMYVNTATTSNYKELETSKKGWNLTGCLMQTDNLLIQGYDTGVVFPYTGENVERSMQVLNLIYTDAEIYQLLVYGIEGEHYISNADGTITRPAADNRTYKGMSNWTLGTCMNSLPETVDTLKQYELALEAQQTAGINPVTGFSFSSKTWDVATESSNLAAVRTEYDWMFFAENYEERYEEFEEQMWAAGLEKYMEAYAKALSEYVTANGLGTVEIAK